MSGNISDDILINAALTDENSPIQPEGSTQTLREFDKVFIEARGSRFAATLGDFNLNVGGSEFGNFERKLQGARGMYNYYLGGSEGDLSAVIATTRGKYTTNEFLGIDGVQGPYRLSGQLSERSIIIVAGTERVYINGMKLTRGENADYTIDYSNAEIVFTPKRIITNSTRIVVDFEYNDRQFSRNLYTAKFTNSSISDRLNFDILYANEADDKETTLDLSLTEADKEILRNAGNDQTLSQKTGAEYAGPGKGEYKLIDTLIQRENLSDTLVQFYRYQPEDTLNAVYIVNFSYVGEGKGNYRKVSVGWYQFSGLLKGNYQPIKILPMPKSHTLLDFNIYGDVSNNLKINGEYTISSLDRNTFSEIGDNSNRGSALNLNLRYFPTDIKIGKLNVGSLDIGIKERHLSSNFNPLGRINEVEFNRIWNAGERNDDKEEIREFSIKYNPDKILSFGGGYGALKRGDALKSVRTNLNSILNTGNRRGYEYHFEKIGTTNPMLMEKSDWFRHFGKMEYRLGSFVPYAEFRSEDLKRRNWESDTITSGSYRFTEGLPGISFGDTDGLFVLSELGLRSEDSLAQGKLQKASTGVSQRYGLRFRYLKWLNTSFDLLFSNKRYSEVFVNRGNKNLNTTLVRSQTRLNPLEGGIESDWFYEVTTGRTAKIDRIFQRVPKGTGTHIYIGDINGNRIIDYPDFQPSRFDGEFILFLLPAGDVVPSVDIKTSSRVRINLRRIFTSGSLISRILAELSTETYFKINEQSTDPDRSKLYLLDFSKYLSDNYTLNGDNLLIQDFYVRENDLNWSLRFRYTQKKGLTQYALSRDRVYFREQAARARWQLVEGIVNQTDFYLRRDMLTSDIYSIRNRSIFSHEEVMDWSYRPDQRLEIGFLFSLKNSKNFDTTRIDNNNQTIRIIYSIVERGQLRGEITREEVTINKSSLTGGKSIGKTWLWRLTCEYRLSQILMFTGQYDGRSENGGLPIHALKMELRAFF